jgi:hypothetical protein
MRLYLSDFDKNGKEEQIICQGINEDYYPIVDKDELISQLPYLKKKVVKYEDYAKARMQDLFTPNQLEESEISELNLLKSSLFLSDPQTGYHSHDLPAEIQYAPVFALAQQNQEKTLKGTFYLGGNQYLVKPQFGRYDASKGWSLKYRIQGTKIEFETPEILGVNGQIRQLEIVNLKRNPQLLIGINNQAVELLELD